MDAILAWENYSMDEYCYGTWFGVAGLSIDS